MPGSSSSKGPVYAVAAATLFGVSTPLAKLLLVEIDPILFAALLYLGSGAGLFLLGKVKRPGGKAVKEGRLDARDYPWLLGATLTGGVLAPISLLYGLRATSAATASLLPSSTSRSWPQPSSPPSSSLSSSGGGFSPPSR